MVLSHNGKVEVFLVCLLPPMRGSLGTRDVFRLLDLTVYLVRLCTCRRILWVHLGVLEEKKTTQLKFGMVGKVKSPTC